jgi:hypothetical protein
LDALVYRVADLAWQEAAGACADPEEARLRAMEAFRSALKMLSSWSGPSMLAIEKRVAASARAWQKPSSQPLTRATAPPEFLEDLRAMARAAIPELREADQRRSFWRLQGYAVVGALLIGLMMILLSYSTIGRWRRVSPELVEGLQFRVRHAGLSSYLRDLAWELPDPQGADYSAMLTLEEAALALDEIVSVASADKAEQLRYLAWRINQQDLPDLLIDLVPVNSAQRQAVMDAALALQEVGNWFGGG